MNKRMCGRSGCSSEGIHPLEIERDDGTITFYSCEAHAEEARSMVARKNDVKIANFSTISPRKTEEVS